MKFVIQPQKRLITSSAIKWPNGFLSKRTVKNFSFIVEHSYNQRSEHTNRFKQRETGGNLSEGIRVIGNEDRRELANSKDIDLGRDFNNLEPSQKLHAAKWDRHTTLRVATKVDAYHWEDWFIIGHGE